MGMLIDEIIRDIKTNILPFDCSESLYCAIEIMRKYQKIEQILSDWINDDLVGMSDYWMGRIKEVVEDGRN